MDVNKELKFVSKKKFWGEVGGGLWGSGWM